MYGLLVVFKRLTLLWNKNHFMSWFRYFYRRCANHCMWRWWHVVILLWYGVLRHRVITGVRRPLWPRDYAEPAVRMVAMMMMLMTFAISTIIMSTSLTVSACFAGDYCRKKNNRYERTYKFCQGLHVCLLYKINELAST